MVLRSYHAYKIIKRLNFNKIYTKWWILSNSSIITNSLTYSLISRQIIINNTRLQVIIIFQMKTCWLTKWCTWTYIRTNNTTKTLIIICSKIKTITTCSKTLGRMSRIRHKTNFFQITKTINSSNYNITLEGRKQKWPTNVLYKKRYGYQSPSRLALWIEN